MFLLDVFCGSVPTHCGFTTDVVYIYKDKNAEIDSQKKTPSSLINVICLTILFAMGRLHFNSWDISVVGAAYEESQHTDVNLRMYVHYMYVCMYVCIMYVCTYVCMYLSICLSIN